MAITSGYFNSVNKDRLYNAETMSKYFSGIISKGVLQNYLNKFVVEAGTGLVVTVGTGRAYFTDGKWMESDAVTNVELNTANPTQNRIDRVVLQCDKSTGVRECKIVYKPGTPNSAPTPPALTNTETIEELSLAQIQVNAGITQIEQQYIVDERPDNSVCGFVHGLINQIDTEGLFEAYDDAFNTWFAGIKETLSTTTLIRKYSSHYTTISGNETEIPINITQYNPSLDVLNVYINGLKLVENVDYTKDVLESETITLTKGLDAEQVVEFEVFKSVDGSSAETVVQQVYELQQQVNKLEDCIYYATGENDNIKLSQMCQEFFTADDLGDQLYIKVVGTNFTVTQPFDGAGSTSSRYKWFSIGPAAKSDKRLILDFSQCNKITIDSALDNSLIFYGASCRIENLKLSAVLGTNVTFIESPNVQVNNCDVELTGSGTVIFGRRYGNFNYNRVYLTSNGGAAYCFEAVNNYLLRVTGGTYYAYTNMVSDSIISAVGIINSNQTNAILLMTNVNCPVVQRTGYYQKKTVKILSGKYTLLGNILGAALDTYSTSAGTETGTIIANIAM